MRFVANARLKFKGGDAEACAKEVVVSDHAVRREMEVFIKS